MKADLVVKNGSIVTPEATLQGGVAIAGGKIVAVEANIAGDATDTIDARGKIVTEGSDPSAVIPGLRAQRREPGTHNAGL